MAMRDWRKTLLPASFRGVPFFVESEDLSGGRRLAEHEYAGGEVTLVEDLGKATKKHDVTAYLTSDTADIKALALQQACDLAGAGMLIMPMDGGRMAHAQGFRRTRERDRTGYIAFDVTFIPAGDMPVAALSIGDVSAAVATGVSSVAAAFASLF
ncbi:DNA circularization N-terminal domain-containing protein [Rhizobium sp. BK602]|uniref:DNA circularization N-terminal domain-containing protein n=1 Tax=Rhizobium sp. BK602 TaxID=2586986 RepID=UPI00160C1BB8|nr:DNA circularization N-terminal domain-containing protein [Rhizobium sp. BK602]MBB3608673.1 prophage DNA circulation protein [Rhizobium sp. BK602]